VEEKRISPLRRAMKLRASGRDDNFGDVWVREYDATFVAAGAKYRDSSASLGMTSCGVDAVARLPSE
jgi:hypothetical protein